MRIAAAVGVRDEAELIERAIAHLRAIGVAHVIVCDMYSTDGTAEILERYRSDDLWVIKVSIDQSQEEWVEANLEAIRRAEVDWVIFLDGDELPLPAGGSLAGCTDLADADVLTIERFNVAVGPDGPLLPDTITPTSLDRLMVFADPERLPWHELEAVPEASWISSRVAPRVMARPEKIENVSLGSHDVSARQGIDLRRAKAEDLVVAHLPFTTPKRFRRKVANVRETLAAHEELFSGNRGRHWRRWIELADRGELDAEFARMVLSNDQLASMRESGAIRSAAELLVASKRRLSR